MKVRSSSLDYLDRTMLHGNVETLLLALLARGDSWPYRMRWDLNDSSNGHFQLSFGRIYPLLQSMEDKGLVRSRLVLVGIVKTRKMYSITTKGHRELTERKRRWRLFRKHVDMVLD